MNTTERSDFTRHASFRLKQRRIPEAMIHEAISNGHRTIHLARHSVEYKLKNVLGVKGLNLVVITDMGGKVITSYAQKVKLTRD